MKYLSPANWLQKRKSFIGSSEVAILCGQSADTTPLDIYYDKRGEKEREISSDLQELLDAGKQQEPITVYNFLKKFDPEIADKVFMKHVTGKKLSAAGNVHLFTEFIHGNVIAHPDLLWKDYNVECKFIKHKGAEWNFHYKKNGNEFGSEGDFPFKYWIQCQAQMLCTGKKKTILAVNYHGAEFYYYKFKFDKSFGKKISKITSDFWGLVEAGTPCMPDNSFEADQLWPNRTYTSMTLRNETEDEKELFDSTLDMKDRYKYLKKRIKDLGAEVKMIGTSIRSLMSIHTVLQTPDGDQIARISEWEEERIIGLSKLKKSDKPEDKRKYKRVRRFLERNGLIEKSVKSRLNF
jgi:predicted phage-related endonuclease